MHSYEGLHFLLSDLRATMAWATVHANVRVCVVTDHFYFPEMIQVSPQGAILPRRYLWRDHLGRLHVDDQKIAEFDLPYPTLERALIFIASQCEFFSRRSRLEKRHFRLNNAMGCHGTRT